MSKPPDPPAEPAEPQKGCGSWLAVASTVLLCAAAYVVLCFLTLNLFGPVLIIAGALFVLVAFHYLVWGWWLGRVVRHAAEDEEDQPGSPV